MLAKYGIAVALVLASAVPAFAANSCIEPIAPVAVDGNTATEAVLKDAIKDVKNYIASSDEYQECILRNVSEAKAKAVKDKKPFDDSIAEDAKKKIDVNQRMKEKVGGEYNAAVAAYKAKHPG